MLRRAEVDSLLHDALDSLEEDGARIQGVVIVAFGIAPYGMRSKIGAATEDEIPIPLAYAYAAPLAAAAALPPEATPGFAAEKA